MKTRSPAKPRPFKLEIFAYGNSYYIDRVAELEKALAKKPRRLRLDLVGVGEISADAALRIRAVLRARSPRTQIITHAHSSLQGGSVLVWLLGDQRLIRDDATIYFRRANLTGLKVAEPDEAWKNESPGYADSYSDVEPEEADYARVLQLINEFLPVNELAGKIVGVPVLRQFGLVENAQVDNFLATAFRKSEPPKGKRALTPR
jgi:hypothetical protein